MGYSIASINSEIASLNGLISKSRSQIVVVNNAILKLNTCKSLYSSLESDVKSNFNVNGKPLNEDNMKLILVNIDSGISSLRSVVSSINSAVSNYSSKINSLNSIKADIIRRQEAARLARQKKSEVHETDE